MAANVRADDIDRCPVCDNREKRSYPARRGSSTQPAPDLRHHVLCGEARYAGGLSKNHQVVLFQLLYTATHPAHSYTVSMLRLENLLEGDATHLGREPTGNDGSATSSKPASSTSWRKTSCPALRSAHPSQVF